MVEGFAFDRQPLTLRTVADDGDEPAVAADESVPAAGRRRRCVVRAARGGAPDGGMVGVRRSADEHLWREPVIEHLQMLADVVSGALQSRRREPREVAAAAAVPIGVARLPTRGRAAPPVRNAFALNLGIADIVGDSPSLQAALAVAR